MHLCISSSTSHCRRHISASSSLSFLLTVCNSTCVRLSVLVTVNLCSDVFVLELGKQCSVNMCEVRVICVLICIFLLPVLRLSLCALMSCPPERIRYLLWMNVKNDVILTYARPHLFYCLFSVIQLLCKVRFLFFILRKYEENELSECTLDTKEINIRQQFCNFSKTKNITHIYLKRLQYNL